MAAVARFYESVLPYLYMKFLRRSAGFTIPELVVVIAIVAISILLSLAFIHPHDYSVSERNNNRLLGLAQISQALTKYHAANGKLPDGITETPTHIGNGEPGAIDLCAVLVPAYMKDIPVDPKNGVKLTTETCLHTKEKPSVYLTGYSIVREKGGAVVLEAPSTEGGEPLRLTRKY